MTESGSSSTLLRLPAHGRLLVCADLRGNVRDFVQVATRFERMGADSHLLFLGDLLHGPYLSESEWSPELGRYYRDESPALFMKLSLLRERCAGRVHALLGNHEHAHIGGPRTARFAADETLVLEQRLGEEAAAFLRGFLAGLPLLALSPCGILLSHGAPGGAPTDLEQLAALDYGRFVPISAQAGEGDEAARLLGQLLWTRALSPEAARRMLPVVGCQVLVYGREIVKGAERIGKEQLILSSSFGLADADKRILELDLSARYGSAQDLREGREIVPLY